MRKSFVLNKGKSKQVLDQIIYFYSLIRLNTNKN